MRDNFNREINYLRISVIDYCNLRCLYCMPPYRVQLKRHENILSFKEIAKIVKIGCEDFGFKKIRLTGGEPLIRRDIVDLVATLSNISGVEDLAMTTNGILLSQYAYDLAAAGLQRANVSLDTVDAKRYAAITRGGDLSMVLRGIDAALHAGLVPLKINCVVEKTSNEADAKAVKEYAKKKGIEIRFIQRMDFARGIFRKVEGGEAGECITCNRMRVLCDGRILPCLFTAKTFAIRKLGVHQALRQALAYKPEKGEPCLAKWMVDIGG